jgi:hypothetical protein
MIYAWINDQKHTTESIYLKWMFMFHSFLYSAVKVWSVILKWYKNLYYWCWHLCTKAHLQVDIVNFKIKMSEQRSIFLLFESCVDHVATSPLPILNILQTTAWLSPLYEGKTRGCHCSHWAPDDGRENARNMLSCKQMSG